MEIKTVSVAGAGTMGLGITISCALAGYHTKLFDVNKQACERAVSLVEKTLNQLLEKGKIAPDTSAQAKKNISISTDPEQLKADLVVEAIAENLTIKQDIFRQVEMLNTSKTILATNTSSLSVSKIASALTNPTRCAGLHFFNPAHIMKLVEVVAGAQTEPVVLATLKAFAKSIGKVSVDAKDSPGFIVNRVARHFYVESLLAVETGAASFEGIDSLMRASGFKMGPFELMDLIGIDVNYAVTQSVYEGFNNASKFKPSPVQKSKIDNGELGRKSGKGFYAYS
ncbi:MAG TPA: 3-hydroxyacyl-CoA dehydrogenase NAD-binding domain-containing protein [Cyclobacteriaceae bacterium]|jgi:3-hydroxybutyryl-CoA dehydrogenase|nr:3-hydroxybutyryl-CoA dehydrogenase [Cytophagales bacterium]HNT48969.1 3-hydroxyacyl-CoA dehydrogenase NAD-binding domain-containing protein [Cyclobacteriaceae bacterium]HRE67429.1 3-hydroxyacyl-CoA dehydrogenase NAD-binding domain-containing protein [Cyclobacteriaceae bacterium]HRF33452.1 3-hydroxyacyl-CoA dehydrogenase NAD-binding domain-containing protein [Cyclobacteriaceae bacterium]